MPARHRLDRYDEHGQDTWTSPDEEDFAAEMGQPSTEPRYEHNPSTAYDDFADEVVKGREAEYHRNRAKVEQHHFPAVLAQTPVRCNKCERMAVPFEDVIVLVDGVWFHDECVGEES